MTKTQMIEAMAELLARHGVLTLDKIIWLASLKDVSPDDVTLAFNSTLEAVRWGIYIGNTIRHRNDV